ncbi:hypothetical protein C0J52_08494 [Blattella germanica]|nr:hypothetical protein C0J52_08494 [Blattella germanica]PSN42371.1 hypothetical protein C0J52_08494 [Blattella germanica]
MEERRKSRKGRTTPRNSPPPSSPEKKPPEQENKAPLKRIFAENYDFVVAALKCQACDSVMVAPIRYCTTGHCFCSNCAFFLKLCIECFKPLLTTCNKNLEGIAKSTGGCLLSGNGCQMKLPLTSIKEHFIRCIYHEIYCPVMCASDLSCNWTGLKKDLREHARDHPHLLFDDLENFYFMDLFSCNPPSTTYFFVILKEEIFLYCRSLYEDTWFVTIVQLVMTMKKYKCVLDLKDANKINKIRMNLPVEKADRKFDSMFKEGKCFRMPYTMMQHFVINKDNFNLKITVNCVK